MGAPESGDEELSPEFVADFITDPKRGRRRLPYLLGLLEHDEQRWRLTAAWALCLTVSEYPETVEYIVTRLSDRLASEDDVSLELTQALDYMASRHPDEVESLLLERAADDEEQRVPLPQTGSFTRSHYYSYEPTREDMGRVNMPGEATQRHIRHRLEDDAGPPGAGGGSAAGRVADLPAEDGEDTTAEADDESEGTMAEVEESMDEVALIAAQSVYDDLNILAARHRGRYADVFRSLGYREEAEEALSLHLFHRPDDESRWDDYSRALGEEIRRWATLGDHDHVVTVRDHGFQPRPWLAAEYTGETLAEHDRLHPHEALRDALTLADALSYVHQNGVVHGAIDPENVAYPGELFGDEDHQAPMLDHVGLMHAFRFYFEPSLALDPRYAAPEYFDDEFGGIDHSTDIYGFGAVCYRLFTGRPPYTGSFAEVREAVTSADPPRPSAAVPRVSEAVDDVVTKAMATHKITRYETVEQLRQALSALGEH